jgi:neutral ceramidase
MKTNLCLNRFLILTFLLTILTSISVYAQNGNLKVGAARLDITPPSYNTISEKYEHEKLFIRAIVLDNGTSKAVLIGIDGGGLSNDIWDATTSAIEKELGCPSENIIMSATHTHSGDRTANPNTLIETFMNVVRMANGNLQPAKVGYGTGKSYLNVNRDVINKDTRLWTQAANIDGPSDKTLAVMIFSDNQGKPIAGYMNYAMHPVNAYLAGFITADFPGAACRYIENSFNDDMVMIFSQGASGDQNPLYLRTGTNVMASKSGIDITGFEMNREEIEAPLREGRIQSGELDPEVGSALKRYIDALGVMLGEEAIRVMSNVNNYSDNVRILGIRDILTVPGRERTNTGREGKPGTYKDANPVDIQLGFLGIGDIALTTINAEVYNVIAQQVKEVSPMSKTMVITLCNGRAASGYIIDDASYEKYTFQVLGSRLQPGYAEKGIIEGLTNLIKQYISSFTSQ